MEKKSDFESFAAVYADQDRAKFIGGRMNRPDAWRHFAAVVGRWTLFGFGIWAAEERDSGSFVGGIGLWYPEGWPELELGYWLVPEAQGKGFATEAGVAAKHYAFLELGATSLVSYIDPANEASKRVAERIGATYETSISLRNFGEHCVYRYERPF